MEKKININRNEYEASMDIVNYNDRLFVTGIKVDTILGNYESYFLKMSLDGDSIYSKIYHDTINSVAQKMLYKDNHFYILKWTADLSPYTNTDIRIVKIDTFGNVLENWNYGGSRIDAIYDFKHTEDGGFILGGNSNSYSADSSSDFMFIKLDSTGVLEWQKTYSGNPNEETVRNHNNLTKTQDGGYVLCGEEGIPFPNVKKGIVLKVDSLGNKLWQKDFAFMQYTNTKSIIEMFDGNLVVTGGVNNYDTIIPFFEDPRGYLMKLSSDGSTIIWQRYFSKYWNHVDDYILGMISTSDGGILVSGYVLGGQGTYNDGFLAKFDSCGYTVGDVPEPLIILDSIIENTVYITDKSQNYCTAELDWGDGTVENYYAYQDNLPLQEKHFSHTYTQTGNFTIKTTTLAGEEFREYEVHVLGLSNENVISNASESISLFPNPANNYVVVESKHTPSPSQEGSFRMIIHTLSGKQIKSISLNHKLYQQQIDVSDLMNGVYFVTFTLNGEQINVEKMVKVN